MKPARIVEKALRARAAAAPRSTPHVRRHLAHARRAVGLAQAMIQSRIGAILDIAAAGAPQRIDHPRHRVRRHRRVRACLDHQQRRAHLLQQRPLIQRQRLAPPFVAMIARDQVGRRRLAHVAGEATQSLDGLRLLGRWRIARRDAVQHVLQEPAPAAIEGDAGIHQAAPGRQQVRHHRAFAAAHGHYPAIPLLPAQQADEGCVIAHALVKVVVPQISGRAVGPFAAVVVPVRQGDLDAVLVDREQIGAWQGMPQVPVDGAIVRHAVAVGALRHHQQAVGGPRRVVPLQVVGDGRTIRPRQEILPGRLGLRGQPGEQRAEARQQGTKHGMHGNDYLRRSRCPSAVHPLPVTLTRKS